MGGEYGDERGSEKGGFERGVLCESMYGSFARAGFDCQKLSNPAYAAQLAAQNALDASAQSDLPVALSGEREMKRRKKFSMTPVSQDELENIRVARPEGVPEWGAPASEDMPVKGRRKEDRWV